MKQNIESKIPTLNGQRVILASDLAELYGVTTKRLNEQVTRNIRRFPKDFMFLLSFQELINLKSHFATSSFPHGGKRKPPRAFTAYGAVMAANVLNSEIAIDASIMIVRVFVKLKEIAHEYSALKKRLQELEQKVAKGFAEHADELQEIRFVLAKLEQPPEIKKGRIGF
ncbi:MAG: ORF6N domain-containing protein [Proteobacteria bacterium]|nr:ORF6N domain-containing protein [Pseudomonadota bacterium]